MKDKIKNILIKILIEGLKYGLFLAVFTIITYLLVKNHIFDPFDNFIIRFKNHYLVNEVLTIVMRAFSLLGEKESYVVILVIAFIIFRKRLYDPVFMTLAVGGTGVINKIVKHIIKRPRPTSALIKLPKSFSFPSGHTMCATLFYLFLIYLVRKNVKDKSVKNLLTIILAIIPIMIGLSRIYLGVHYTTDVLFGAILGSVTLIPFVEIYKCVKKEFKW